MGPLLKSGKSRSTWHAAHFRLLGAVQKGLFLTFCLQFRTAMPNQMVSVLAASMASTWVLGWGSMCNEVIYPDELPVGLSTLLSRGPRSLSDAHWRPGVEPPRTCTPSSPTQVPSEGSSVLPWIVLLSRWTAVGLRTLQSWGPHSLSAVLHGPVLSSAHVHVLVPGLLL